jgi:hypothetical protein
MTATPRILMATEHSMVENVPSHDDFTGLFTRLEGENIKILT